MVLVVFQQVSCLNSILIILFRTSPYFFATCQTILLKISVSNPPFSNKSAESADEVPFSSPSSTPNPHTFGQSRFHPPCAAGERAAAQGRQRASQLRTAEPGQAGDFQGVMLAE